jgi:YhcH/YjgK/YiaL family protein
MIVDTLDRWERYFQNDAWRTAFEYLASLGPDSPEVETLLQGQKIRGKVMSYETRGVESAVLESHREHIDIQMTLIGSEGIDWFPRGSLEVKDPYDPKTDVEFYQRPGEAPARVRVHPGTFVVLFPEDAHMPQLMTGPQAMAIKKVVVKLAVELARPE